jgi:glutamate synthase domain-containing protein 2
LAQLVIDLKNVSQQHSASVKLVSETSVTVAAGAGQDTCGDYNTMAARGASPWCELSMASPWNRPGRNQQTLVFMPARYSRARADGQMKTDRDVVDGACWSRRVRLC